MNYDLWPLVRLHFSRRFRICAKFGLIRSFYRSNARQTGFNGQIWQKSPKIDDQWHVTPYSIAFFKRIPNQCYVWSNSVKLSVKYTSNRVLLVRNGKSPKVAWIMSCGPLFHCVFGEDYESVLSLTSFGQLTGELQVKLGLNSVKILLDWWVMLLDQFIDFKIRTESQKVKILIVTRRKI